MSDDEFLPKPFWRTRTFQVILTGVMLFTFWFLIIRTPPLVVSTKTTRITGPLTADGQIDFLKAVEQWSYPPEMATDDNGFRVFTRLFGDCGDYGSSMTPADQEFYRAQKYDKLGLDPKAPPTMVLPRHPWKIVEEHFKTAGVDIPEGTELKLRNKLWTLDEFPMLADWVKECDAPLDAIAEAIRKPVFMPPLLQSPESYHSGKPQNLISLLLPDIQSLRDTARLFQARAAYRIATGNIDGAIDDKLTLIRLGRLIIPKSVLVQHLVGIAIQGVGYAVPVGANPEHPPTEKQLRRLLDEIDNLPPRISMGDSFEFERYFGLGAIQAVSHDGDLSFFNGSGTAVGVLPYFCNWNFVFRRMNEAYDAMQEPPPRTKIHAITSAKPSVLWSGVFILTPNGRAEILTDMFFNLLLPAFDAAEEAARRSECVDNVQRLTLAILLYQAEHGKFPDENWAKQIEKYLGKEPEKFFRCPSSTIPDGETRYALVQYGTELPADPDTILLVELADSVPCDKAIISVADVRDRKGIGSSHPGVFNAGFRSGAVRAISTKSTDDEFHPMLGITKPAPEASTSAIPSGALP